MFSFFKEKLFDYLTSKYIRTTNIEKVFTITKEGYVFIDGKLVSKEDAERLRTEAFFFKKSLLFSVLVSTPKKQAEDNLFKKSNDLNDMRFSKAALWTIDVQEKIMEKLTQ